MSEISSIVPFVAIAVSLTALVRPRGLVETVLSYMTCLFASVLVCGYAVSLLRRLSDLRCWILTEACLLLIVTLSLLCSRRLRPKALPPDCTSRLHYPI